MFDFKLECQASSSVVAVAMRVCVASQCDVEGNRLTSLCSMGRLGVRSKARGGSRESVWGWFLCCQAATMRVLDHSVLHPQLHVRSGLRLSLANPFVGLR